MVVLVAIIWLFPARPNPSPSTSVPATATTAAPPSAKQPAAPSRQQASAAASQEPEWLAFSRISVSPAIRAIQPGTIAAYTVTLDPEALQATLSAGRPFALTFPAPTGRVVFSPDRAPRAGSLFGHLAADPTSQFQLVHHRGATYLNLSRYACGEHWILNVPAGPSAPRTSGTLLRIDPALMPENCAACASGIPHPHATSSTPHDSPAPESPGAVSSEEETTPIQGAPQPELITGADRETPYLVDLFVGYSIKARQNAGGTAAIEAQIIAATDRINQAFVNSAVNNLEVALIGTMEDPDWADPGSGDMNTELVNLSNTNSSNPTFNTITAAAAAAGADRVMFLADNAFGGTAGLAYTPGPCGIVARTYVNAVNLTFEHEFGHTLTARHQITDNTPTITYKTKRYYGWVLKGTDEKTYRSVLATPTGDTRIPYYSNPDILFQGARTGATDGYNATGDPTVGQASLIPGYYDGTNPSLGANNARAFRDYAKTAETGSTRPGTFTASINGTSVNATANTTYPVPEGGTLSFSVVFSSAILHETRVIVLPQSASNPVIDSDLTRTTGTLTFTPSNWNIPQTLTFAALEDFDNASGKSEIVIKAQGHTGTDSLLNVTLLEQDNEPSDAPALTRVHPANPGVRLAAGIALPLAFTATDDGKPSPILTYSWSQLSAPAGGTATFSSPTSTSTSAIFSADGNYLLRGSAFDGEFHSHLDIWVTVGDTTTTDLGVARETDQGIVIEAEDFNASNAGSTGRTWAADISAPGAFAGGIVRAIPATGSDLGDSATTGPRLDYSFRGVTTPNLNIVALAIRARSTTGATAKVNLGLNGSRLDTVTLDATGQWAWKTALVPTTAYTGLSTLSVWQNSPGVEIDRVAVLPEGSPLLTALNNGQEPGLSLRTDSVFQPNFAAWITLFPTLTGNSALPNVDPDADGLPNLIEYALGFAPTTPSTTPLLQHSATPGSHLTLTFTPKVITGLTYTIQSSSDLILWTDTDITDDLTPDTPFTHTHPTTNPKRFLRLKVSE
jgi:hypothetical protein